MKRFYYGLYEIGNGNVFVFASKAQRDNWTHEGKKAISAKEARQIAKKEWNVHFVDSNHVATLQPTTNFF